VISDPAPNASEGSDVVPRITPPDVWAQAVADPLFTHRFSCAGLGSREAALLSPRALEYNPRTQWRHKRLTRFYSRLWGCRPTVTAYDKPLKISTIFSDGLRTKIDTRSLASTKESFVECHRTLMRDEVIARWRYAQQEGPWQEWTVIIDPPENVRRSYEEGPHTVPIFDVPTLFTTEWGARIRARRESLGHSQRGLQRNSVFRRVHSAGPKLEQPLPWKFCATG
jgi:hypothetical protein